ncbi:hypothetical protein HZB88_04235 [archaeon]|nr:hypothetical protein [archaeon]
MRTGRDTGYSSKESAHEFSEQVKWAVIFRECLFHNVAYLLYVISQNRVNGSPTMDDIYRAFEAHNPFELSENGISSLVDRLLNAGIIATKTEKGNLVFGLTRKGTDYITLAEYMKERLYDTIFFGNQRKKVSSQ